MERDQPILKRKFKFTPEMDGGQIVQTIIFLVGLGIAIGREESNISRLDERRIADSLTAQAALSSAVSERNLKFQAVDARLGKMDELIASFKDLPVKQAEMLAEIRNMTFRFESLQSEVRGLSSKTRDPNEQR